MAPRKASKKPQPGKIDDGGKRFTRKKRPTVRNQSKRILFESNGEKDHAFTSYHDGGYYFRNFGKDGKITSAYYNTGRGHIFFQDAKAKVAYYENMKKGSGKMLRVPKGKEKRVVSRKLLRQVSCGKKLAEAAKKHFSCFKWC